MKRISFFVFVISLLFACKEDSVVSEISGRVFYDCSNTPYPFAEVALKTQVGESFSEQIIIGGAVANNSGQFNFTYEIETDLKGKATLILLKEQGYTTLFSDLPLKDDHFFNVYVENTATIVINLSGSKVFAATDTLFIATKINQNPSMIIQPSSGYIDTIYANIPNQYKSTKSSTLIYGIGLADFEKSKESLSIQDSIYNQQTIQLDGCAKNDIIDLVIN